MELGENVQLAQQAYGANSPLVPLRPELERAIRVLCDERARQASRLLFEDL